MYGYYNYCICCRLICFLGQSVFNLGQFVSRKPEIFSIDWTNKQGNKAFKVTTLSFFRTSEMTTTLFLADGKFSVFTLH